MNIRDELVLRDPGAVALRIAGFLCTQMNLQHRDGLILGLSGGVDSALSAFLAVRAAGASHVALLFMPERDTSPASRVHAELVAHALGAPLKVQSITPLVAAAGAYRLEPPARFVPRSVQERYVTSRARALQAGQRSTFIRTLRGGDGVEELRRSNAYLHIKHRLRMVLWYFAAELDNLLVIGNCNLSEKLTGYFIRYGDSASDVDPIAGLYKTQVLQLARHVGVPEEIVAQAPSPDLAPGLTDEFALQMTYDLLDQILWGLRHGMDPTVLARDTGAASEDIAYVQELMQLSRSMRELPPSPDLADLVS